MNCIAVRKSVGVAAAGAVFVDVDSPPDPGTTRAHTFWYIEGYSGQCERLRVHDATGSRLLLSQPTKMQHPGNSFVFCLNRKRITPHLYGSIQGSTEGRQFADDSLPLQRLSLEHQGTRWQMGFGFLGANMGRPWLVPDGTHAEYGYIGFRTDVWDARCTQTGIPNDFPSQGSSLMKSCGGYCGFNAFVDNTIVLDVALNIAVGDPIIFKDVYPNAVAFPSPLVDGKHYLVKTWNPSTRTMTISEVATPTVELDITVAGDGMAFSQFTDEIMYGFNRMEMTGGNVFGIDAAQLSAKPGAFTKDFRCFGCMCFIGTAGHHENLESQSGQPGSGGADLPGLWFEGRAHDIDYINQNGGNIGTKYGPSYGIRVAMHYVEGVAHWGQDILAGCKGLVIKQQLNNRATNTATVHDGAGGTLTSYDVGPVNLQLTDHETHEIAGMPQPFKTQNGIWDWNEGDIRYSVAGLHKTPHGVKAKMRIPVGMGSSGDEIWSHRLGRGQDGCIFTRSSGDLFLPDPTGMEPGMDWWMYKQSNGGAYPGGTVNVKDHLGNVLYTFTSAGDLKWFRYLPTDETTAYSVSFWHVAAN